MMGQMVVGYSSIWTPLITALPNPWDCLLMSKANKVE